MLFQEPGDFVGCTHSNPSALSVCEQSRFYTLGYRRTSQAPATTGGKYAAACHILPDDTLAVFSQMARSATLTSSVF